MKSKPQVDALNVVTANVAKSFFAGATQIVNCEEFKNIIPTAEVSWENVITNWHIANIALMQIAGIEAVPDLKNEKYKRFVAGVCSGYFCLIEQVDKSNEDFLKSAEYVSFAKDTGSFSRSSWRWAEHFLLSIEIFDPRELAKATVKIARVFDGQFVMYRQTFVQMRIKIAESG